MAGGRTPIPGVAASNEQTASMNQWRCRTVTARSQAHAAALITWAQIHSAANPSFNYGWIGFRTPPLKDGQISPAPAGTENSKFPSQAAERVEFPRLGGDP